MYMSNINIFGIDIDEHRAVSGLSPGHTQEQACSRQQQEFVALEQTSKAKYKYTYID